MARIADEQAVIQHLAKNPRSTSAELGAAAFPPRKSNVWARRACLRLRKKGLVDFDKLGMMCLWYLTEKGRKLV